MAEFSNRGNQPFVWPLEHTDQFYIDLQGYSFDINSLYELDLLVSTVF